ncbi:MAG: butyrate kinase [Peptococcaceae bacterium]|nr:butyrate kinase [Peptococcaceae bacterium]
MKILVINPGSTSTKIAVFESEKCAWQTGIRHPDEELGLFERVADQYRYRLEAVERALAESGHALNGFDALAARGGLLKPLEGGTYLIDREMLNDLAECKYGEHASNLGAVIASSLAEKYGLPAYIVDPVSVDEFHDPARFSGLPELPRVSKSHALNMRAVAREAASLKGIPPDWINLVVAHLGSGISVAAFARGKMIDVNNANNEGPFSLERCGGLPSLDLVNLCYSGKYTGEEMAARIVKTGGIYAYLGTRDFAGVEEMVAGGDEKARRVVEAMCYQVAKEIGAMSTVLQGRVDGIVLTGGMAHSRLVVDEITARVSFIAGVLVIPGEKEMEALARGVVRVLTGKEEVKFYGRRPAGSREEKND